MKKVLYVPFFSQQDKETKKFLLECDSNMHIMRMVVGVLEELDCVVDVTLPYIPSKELFGNLRVKLFNPPADNVLQRYHFNMDDYVYFFDAEYDMIINNSPELTKNIYAAYYHKHRKFPKIITLNHFLDFPSEGKIPFRMSYFPRQVESVEISNKTVFLCQPTIDKFIEESGIRYDYALWRMTFSTNELNSLLGDNEKYPVKTIIFPNRISKTNHSNHEAFIDAINKLAKIRQDFEVVFCNITKAYTDQELIDRTPLSRCFGTQSREAWLNEASKCHIAFSSINDMHGGLSIREAIYAGCMPVVPERDDYLYIVPDDFQYFVKPDLSNLVEVFNQILDAPYDPAYRVAIMKDSFEFNKDVIKSDIGKVLYEKDI
jgi:glycosyltransferase involved in cell wall biosynthesis